MNIEETRFDLGEHFGTVYKSPTEVEEDLIRLEKLLERDDRSDSEDKQLMSIIREYNLKLYRL